MLLTNDWHSALAVSQSLYERFTVPVAQTLHFLAYEGVIYCQCKTSSLNIQVYSTAVCVLYCPCKLLQLQCFLWGLHRLQWQLIWSVHWVVIGWGVFLSMLVLCKIHKHLKYYGGKKKFLETNSRQALKITHTALGSLWTFLYPSNFCSPPSSASKPNTNHTRNNRAPVNELPDKGYEALSKRLSSNSECQFDISYQLRRRIKQSFFSLWCPFNVRRNQSYGFL